MNPFGVGSRGITLVGLTLVIGGMSGEIRPS